MRFRPIHRPPLSLGANPAHHGGNPGVDAVYVPLRSRWLHQGVSGASQGGFTLVELIATIVVAGVLAAIALVSYAPLMARAKAVGAKQGIHALLLKAYATVKSGELRPEQLEAEAASSDDGKFTYFPELVSPWYVVEAEAIGDAALQGKTMIGCIDLDSGTITMQRDFDTPVSGCGLEESVSTAGGKGNPGGNGGNPAGNGSQGRRLGWGRGGSQ
jgi:prepilin-type N-terminal cleavage/methylation domain-containing protein